MTIGIVGQGYMGRTHAEAWAELGYEDRIRYITAPGDRSWLSPAPHARLVHDFGEVLADPEVDVLSICTPTASHAELVIRALRAGKNVLVEKPIALTLEDAWRMAAAAEASGTVLMVAHVVRFFAGYRQAETMWQEGRLGPVGSVRAARVAPRPTWSSWIADPTRSGGILVDFAVHDFDQLNLYLGFPRTVSAVRLSEQGPVETTVEYGDGGIGQVLSHANMPEGLPFSSAIELLGSAGALSYRFRAPSPTAAGDPSNKAGTSMLTFSSASEQWTAHVVDNQPYLREVEYFLEQVVAGSRPTVGTAESAIQALAVSLAANESLAKRIPISVDTRH